MKKALVIGLLTGLAGSFVGFKFWSYATTPVLERSQDDDIKKVLGRAARNPTAVPTGQNRFEGKYMSFAYPAKARNYPVQKANASILEVVDLEIDIPRLTITAAVSREEEATLEEISGVKMRRQNPKMYTEESVGIFVKSDGKERTGFRLYQGRSYTLSVTGNDANGVTGLWAEVAPTWKSF